MLKASGASNAACRIRLAGEIFNLELPHRDVYYIYSVSLVKYAFRICSAVSLYL